MDDRAPDNKPKEKTGFDGFLKGIYRPGPLICLFTLAFLALAGLGWMALNEKTPPPQVIAPLAEERKAEPEPETAPDKVYEEATSDMEDHVKQADLALIETMRDLDLKMHDLDLVDVELRRFEERELPFPGPSISQGQGPQTGFS